MFHSPAICFIFVDTAQKHQEEAGLEASSSDLDDAKRARRLVRKMDLHILPLCAWVYLLNYLDRGNIGNSKVLNQETGDSLLQRTGMNNMDYAVAVSLFSLAYALFEVPSNWIMKRYVRPSRWLATLLFCWGAFTIGFAGVQNYASVVVLRFFVGVFEAGFFPGKLLLQHSPLQLQQTLNSHRLRLPHHLLVPGRRALRPRRLHPRLRHRRRRLRRLHRLRRRPHQRRSLPLRLPLALHHRRARHHLQRAARPLLPARLPLSRAIPLPF